MPADGEAGHFEGLGHVEDDEGLEGGVDGGAEGAEEDESQDSDVGNQPSGGLEVFGEVEIVGRFSAPGLEAPEYGDGGEEHGNRDADADPSPVEAGEFEAADGATEEEPDDDGAGGVADLRAGEVGGHGDASTLGIPGSEGSECGGVPEAGAETDDGDGESD